MIVDYPFITGRSTPDSLPRPGEKLVEVLENGPAPLRLVHRRRTLT